MGMDRRRLRRDNASCFAFAGDALMELADLRNDYGRLELRETDVDPDPFRQFDEWMQQAVASGIPEPNAVALATATPDGKPSVRMVLLRGVDKTGFRFFTNYQSRKAQELAAN